MSGDVPGPAPDPEPEVAPRQCPWCSAEATVDATYCSSCGASLAERPEVSGMRIPGVTEVDPQVEAAEAAAHARALRAMTHSGGLGATLGLSGGLIGFAVGSAIDALSSHGTESNQGRDPLVDSLQMASYLDRQARAQAEATPDAPETSLPGGASTPDPWADMPATTSETIEMPPVANELTTPPGAPGPNELTFPTSTITEEVTDPWAGAQSDPWANNTDPWATGGGPWSQDQWSVPTGTEEKKPR
jgi:hypothetical protein